MRLINLSSNPINLIGTNDSEISLAALNNDGCQLDLPLDLKLVSIITTTLNSKILVQVTESEYGDLVNYIKDGNFVDTTLLRINNTFIEGDEAYSIDPNQNSKTLDENSYIYAEFILSSSVIRSLLGSNSQELLPALSNPDEYYDIHKIILEFTPGVESFNNVDTIAMSLNQSNEPLVFFDPAFLAFLNKVVFIANPHPTIVISTTTPRHLPFEPGGNVTIGFSDGIPATEGDGSIKVKLWYKLRKL
jgi:hypothetical protein